MASVHFDQQHAQLRGDEQVAGPVKGGGLVVAFGIRPVAEPLVPARQGNQLAESGAQIRVGALHCVAARMFQVGR